MKFAFCSHHNIWRQAEVPVETFHYYHPDTKGLDFSALVSDVKVKISKLWYEFHASCLSNK